MKLNNFVIINFNCDYISSFNFISCLILEINTVYFIKKYKMIAHVLLQLPINENTKKREENECFIGVKRDEET